VKGIGTLRSEDKYLFIEDKHHIGDVDMLQNEATKGENNSNVLTFTVMFAIMCLSAVFCCYLNYNFPATLSRNVFYMFLITFFAD
jgi:hypothetical protein